MRSNRFAKYLPFQQNLGMQNCASDYKIFSDLRPIIQDLNSKKTIAAQIIDEQQVENNEEQHDQEQQEPATSRENKWNKFAKQNDAQQNDDEDDGIVITTEMPDKKRKRKNSNKNSSYDDQPAVESALDYYEDDNDTVEEPQRKRIKKTKTSDEYQYDAPIREKKQQMVDSFSEPTTAKPIASSRQQPTKASVQATTSSKWSKYSAPKPSEDDE